MPGTIDTIDYSILKCLHDTDNAFWKKRIHQELADRQAVLPITDQISLQTVGRRVDDLHDEEYLENTIVSPQEVARDLIIGYTLTDAGNMAMQRKRKELLQDVVRDEVFDDTPRPDMTQAVLVEMIGNELELDRQLDRKPATYERDELLVFIGAYILRTKRAAITDADIQEFRNVLERQESLSTILN